MGRTLKQDINMAKTVLFTAMIEHRLIRSCLEREQLPLPHRVALNAVRAARRQCVIPTTRSCLECVADTPVAMLERLADGDMNVVRDLLAVNQWLVDVTRHSMMQNAIGRGKVEPNGPREPNLAAHTGREKPPFSFTCTSCRQDDLDLQVLQRIFPAEQPVALDYLMGQVDFYDVGTITTVVDDHPQQNEPVRPARAQGGAPKILNIYDPRDETTNAEIDQRLIDKRERPGFEELCTLIRACEREMEWLHHEKKKKKERKQQGLLLFSSL
ncbi:MAG: hypothetical protein CL799_00625 [Chromatiales bacterium]|nr:hypothetical protein [Chromatiales bacterium]